MSDINITVNDEIVNIDVIDEPVLVNVVNSPGVPGAPGQGVPVGGTTGQVLAKNSNTNYDTEWVDVSGGAWGTITGTLSNQTDLQNALNAKFDDPTGDTTQYIAGDGSLVAFPITGQAGTLVREVRNVTGATITKGTVVYINGASGNKPTVAKALATSDATSAQTFGLIQADIPNNSNGYLVAFGDLDGLNTSAFAEGVQLYLSATTAGGYTSTKQYAPNHLVYIGVVTRQHVNQGRIEVRIQNGYEMDELHDVAAQTPSNNDGLFYNSTNLLWENKSIATALGYTPANAATTLTINGVTFDLSTSRTYTVGSVTGSGASGQVAYWTGTSAQSGSNNLFWDNASGFLGIGTNTPINPLHVVGSVIAIRASLANGDGCVISNDSTMSYFQALTAGNLVRDFNIAGKEIIFRSGSSSYSERFRLFSTGNLGIGTGSTDGGQRLQVQGTTLLNGNVTFSSATGMFWDAANSRLGIGTNAPAVTLHMAGISHVGAATTLLLQPSGSNPYIASSGSNSFGVRCSAGVDFANYNGTTIWARVANTGNFIINSSGDSGERFQVSGNAKVTGNLQVNGYLFAGIPSIFPSTDLGNTINTGSGGVFIGYTSGPTYTAAPSVTLGKPIGFSNTHTSGEMQMVVSTGSYAPTSGTGTFIYHTIRGTINQTGGANGITRGLYVNPTLTNAFDWRSIEWSNNSGWGLYGAGTSNNYLNGDTAIGTLTLGTSTKLTIGGSETAASGIARGELNNTTLVASANNDVLVGLDINPTFTNGSFTGVNNIPLRVGGTTVISGGFGDAAARIRTLISNLASGTYTQLAIQGPTNGGAAVEMYDGSGNAVADFGMNTLAKEFGFVNRMTSGFINFYTHNGSSLGSRLHISTVGNVLINSTTDSGERLQVTGTMKVTGASTFNGNMNLTRTVNATTEILISNTTSGPNSSAGFTLTSSAGTAYIAKYSDTTTAFKILTPNTAYLANFTSGNIAILNNATSGEILLAAGGSSTAHLTIKSNGRINISSLPTSSTGLATGDLWNDAGTIKIV
jgi:hypothetical protein